MIWKSFNDGTEKLKSLGVSKLLVSYSGGKDAIVTMDLCARHFKVTPYFYYIVKGLDIFEEHFARLEVKYGVKVLQFPHPYLKFQTIGRWKYAGDDETRTVKMDEFENYVRTKTNTQFIASGIKKADGMVRRIRLNQTGIVDLNGKHFFPVMDFKKGDIEAYIKITKCLKPLEFGLSSKRISSEMNLSYDNIAYMKKFHYTDYLKIKKEFPFIDVLHARDELYDRKQRDGKIKVSDFDLSSNKSLVD